MQKCKLLLYINFISNLFVKLLSILTISQLFLLYFLIDIHKWLMIDLFYLSNLYIIYLFFFCNYAYPDFAFAQQICKICKKADFAFTYHLPSRFFPIQRTLQFNYVIGKQYIPGFCFFIQSIIFEMVTDLLGICYYYLILCFLFFIPLCPVTFFTINFPHCIFCLLLFFLFQLFPKKS